MFCGYGEPACRWDDMGLPRLKEMGNYTLRVNTNGLADCITGATPRRKCTGFLDIVSVSLNAPTAEKYDDAVCHRKYGPEAFDAMLHLRQKPKTCRMW